MFGKIDCNQNIIVSPECENVFLAYSPLTQRQEWTRSHMVKYWEDGIIATKVWTLNQIRGWFIQSNLRQLFVHFEIDDDSNE